MVEGVKGIFDQLGGTMVNDYPTINSQVYHTDRGTPYLKQAGVAMIAKPQVQLAGVRQYLQGYGLGYENYLEDPTKLTDAEQLVKFAGQVCYASFAEKRSWNADAERYFKNIIESGHGSVLEHANFSFLYWGISRSLTHELVRHRAGTAFSQLSQRFVSGRVLRFVERPEYQNNPKLHTAFVNRIDRYAREYEDTADELLALQNDGEQVMSAESKTDKRKKVQQAARSLLPNETETVMVFTGNVRALRHIPSMRANEHAEVEIRDLAFKTWVCMAIGAQGLYQDYRSISLPDGTFAVKTDFPKV